MTGAHALPIQVHGEHCLLDGRRALYWPGGGVLAVADVHLGKGEHFRRQGVAVPSGHSQADCDALDALLQDYRPKRLVICGDLFHARITGSEDWLTPLRALRQRHASVGFDVALGNHDRKTRDMAAALPELDIRWHERLDLPPFVFGHEPDAEAEFKADARSYLVCGHLHPVVRLHDGGDSLRLPVLWLRAHCAVLPAFGSFTGGMPVTLSTGERAFAVTPESVIALPAVPPRKHQQRGNTSCAS